MVGRPPWVLLPWAPQLVGVGWPAVCTAAQLCDPVLRALKTQVRLRPTAPDLGLIWRGLCAGGRRDSEKGSDSREHRQVLLAPTAHGRRGFTPPAASSPGLSSREDGFLRTTFFSKILPIGINSTFFKKDVSIWKKIGSLHLGFRKLEF